MWMYGFFSADKSGIVDCVSVCVCVFVCLFVCQCCNLCCVSGSAGRLLHQACMWENAELLEDLLKNGEEVGNIDAEDKYGRSPLHSAAKSANASLVAVLLNAGGGSIHVEEIHCSSLRSID